MMAAPSEQFSLRLPSDLLERAEKLAPLVAEKLPYVRITRAAVLRIALERGLARLEKEHGVKPFGKRRGKPPA